MASLPLTGGRKIAMIGLCRRATLGLLLVLLPFRVLADPAGLAPFPSPHGAACADRQSRQANGIWLRGGLRHTDEAEEGLCGAVEHHPVALSHGINITGWFRFPASRVPAALAGYMSDQALADLRRAGFDFVRLAIEPAIVETQREILVAAIRRIQHQGLTVIVSPHPRDWRLENSETDRERLRSFWKVLAPALRPLDVARTVPEVLNEPVFPNDPAGWIALQHQVLSDIRQALPDSTVVLTGQDWGSVGGLTALTPEDDPNVIYSFHFYDPSELTSLAAYRPGLDRDALARLPFPADDRPRCEAVAGESSDPPTRDLIRYYCSLDWNEMRIGAVLDQAVAWGRSHHARLVAGEFGASAALNPAARVAWLHTVRTAFEARGIAWALWGYDDVMGLGVSRPPGARPSLDQAVLTALGMTTRM